jgi:hypothetical protein
MNTVAGGRGSGSSPRLSVSAEFVASSGAATVGMGERLGLYEALDALGGASSVELATHRCLPFWFTQGWLTAQVAGGYLTHDEATDTYRLGCELPAVS